LNFVTVNFRKAYEKRPAFTRTVTFDHADVEAGRTVRSVAFPRLGAKDPDWTEYEYQIRWSLRDGPTLGVPPATGEDPEPWLRSRDVGVSLAPPFRRELVEIELEREAFASAGLTTAVVEFAGVLGGERRVIARRTLRSSDAESVTQLSLYRDRGQPIAYRVSWFGPRRQERGDLQLLPEANFLFLVAPARRPDAAGPQ
jgi:hypothetical protein